LFLRPQLRQKSQYFFSPALGLGLADSCDLPQLRDVGRTSHGQLRQFAVVEDQVWRQAIMLGLAAAPEPEFIVNPLSLRVKLRAPVLALGIRRLARSAAVRDISVAQDQQERRCLFVDEEMFRNFDNVLAQLEISKLSLIEEPRGRVQAQGKNLELHRPSRTAGLRALLRSLTGRGLRTRPARSLRELNSGLLTRGRNRCNIRGLVAQA
jgi:hypothetical protein